MENVIYECSHQLNFLFIFVFHNSARVCIVHKFQCYKNGFQTFDLAFFIIFSQRFHLADRIFGYYEKNPQTMMNQIPIFDFQCHVKWTPNEFFSFFLGDQNFQYVGLQWTSKCFLYQIFPFSSGRDFMISILNFLSSSSGISW